MSPDVNAFLIAVVSQRSDELRTMAYAAEHMFRAGHPQVLELKRQLQLAEIALVELQGRARAAA